VRRLGKASSAGSIDGTGSSRGHFRRGFAALAGTGSMALVLALFVAPTASADWGYEQVSPFEKGGAAVSAIDTFTAAPDGETILYSGMGSFAEVPSLSLPVYVRYFAERGSDRWISKATDPPYDLPTGGVTSGARFGIMITLRSSVNMRYSIEASARALTPGAIQGGSNLYMQDNRTGELTLMLADADNAQVAHSLSTLGETNYLWVAPDGKGALFYAATEIDGQPKGLVQWTEAGGLEFVGYYPPEEGTQETGLETVFAQETGTREPLPADDALSKLYLSKGGSGSPSTPVYLRENGVVTPISVSQKTGDEGRVVKAQPNAVTEGGRYVFLTTTEGALTDETPESASARILYRYDSTNGDLEYIGYGGSSGTTIGVIQASPDGSTVAFVSTAALTPGSEEAPSKGMNLYLWRNGQLHHIFKTDAGSNMGSAWTARSLLSLSRSGRYLSFTDNSTSLASKYGTDTVSLACAEPKAPTVALSCDEAYVYDADANAGLGTLECASCVEGVASGGNGDPSGGNSGFNRYNNHGPQSVSSNGRVFFTTFESFDPADQNGLEDVYEFHGGEHRLVSTAREGHSSRFVDASEDGKTIFFTTTDAIVPQDKDRVLDLYMSREGAGFPYAPPPETPPCLGLETCHGGIPGITPGPNPSTATFHGRSNPEIAVGKVTVTRAAATGRAVRVTVRVSGPGRVTASGPGLRKASKRARKAGKVTLRLRLAPQSEKALKTHGRLNRKVTVSFQPSEGRGATASKALTLKAPGKQKPAKRKGGN
jgi:hypothetical protein